MFVLLLIFTRLSSAYNSLALRLSMSSLQLVRYCVSTQVTTISSRQNGKFAYNLFAWFVTVYTTASYTGHAFSVHSTIIVTNVFINQAESYYVITKYG